MIGIVVVAHSRALADAAVALASEMVDAAARPRIAVAAGLDETTFGTDAAAISEAITAADSGGGVLVLMDLGSAILSAEMALEFIDPDVADRVRLTPAPFVEGLVAAVVSAAGGGSLDAVDAEARRGAAGKIAHLAGSPGEDADLTPSLEQPPAAEGLSWHHLMTNPHGLHARPAAAFVGAFRGLDATASLRNLTTSSRRVDALSLTQIATLGIERGHEIEAMISGPDAELAVSRLDALAADAFGEAQQIDAARGGESPRPPAATTGGGPAVAAPGAPARPAAGPISGPAVLLDLTPPAGAPSMVDVAGAQRAVAEHLHSLTGEEEPASAIIGAQLAMLDDPTLARAVQKLVRAGSAPASAVEQATATIEQQFASAGSDYLRERAADIRSLRRLLLLALAGQDLRLPQPAAGVLVIDELDAATALQLSASCTPGVLTARPGETGHGALIARARGIAVATGIPIEGISPGQLVTVPPTGG